MSDERNDMLARVGWALVTELHRDVPEDDRPLSWSDLSYEQERRIMCAAALAIRAAQEPMTKESEDRWFVGWDRRRRQALSVAHYVMGVIGKDMDHDQRAHIHVKLADALYLDGVEVITEKDRADAGLPPRGPDGWTREELVIMENARKLAMLQPLPTFVGADFGKTSGQ